MLTITSETKGNVAIINVKGRVDGMSAPELDQALQKAIQDKHYRIVTDLSGTDFMSSAGMRALLKARIDVQDKKGELRLAAPSAYLLDSLKLVGLDKLFQIYPSRVSALVDF